MKTVAIIIILLASDFCNAQTVSDNKLSYYGELSKEANKQHQNSPYQVIDVDSLFNLVFSVGKAQIKMDTSSNWKLLFEIKTEWIHNARVEQGNYSFDLYQDTNPSITKETSNFPKKNIMTIYDSSKVYNGKELFLGLNMDSMFLRNSPKSWLKMWKHDTDSMKCFPQVHERNDPLNRIWSPIICEDYLILRFVHSYPDGNETSFYREIILLFKKENI